MFPGGGCSLPGTNIVKASCLPSGDQVIPPQVSARFVRRISLPGVHPADDELSVSAARARRKRCDCRPATNAASWPHARATAVRGRRFHRSSRSRVSIAFRPS